MPDLRREFDPDPRMICDGGLQPCQLDENKVIPGDVLDLDFIREASADELRAAGIEPDDREKLLRGEHISTSFCICLGSVRRPRWPRSRTTESDQFPPEPEKNT